MRYIFGSSVVLENEFHDRRFWPLGERISTQLCSSAVKRTTDVLFAFALLIVLCPFMLLIGVLVRISSPGPAIYRQRRLTNGGRVFTMYKFRTMATTAEATTGAVMARRGDTRVTRLGRLLRRSRIDELPQLLNVLIGDMSLVGPRPERPEIAGKLSQSLPLMHRRLEVRAGLTGLAQIRCEYADCAESYTEKLHWDLEYIDSRSLALDVQVLAETVLVVLTGRGAR